jgi:hypothetical protein
MTDFNIDDVVDVRFDGETVRCVIDAIKANRNEYFCKGVGFRGWCVPEEITFVSEASDLEEAEVDECGPKKVWLVFDSVTTDLIGAYTNENDADWEIMNDWNYVIREVEVYV